MNLKKLTLRFFSVITVIALLLTGISCSDTDTTDPTSFTIYYSGMTDIGPSMSGVIKSPTYIGPDPSNFAITRITVNEEAYSGDIFQIDTDNGAISIVNTNDAPVGLYRISVSCSAGGRYYEYKDIVEVNMMKPIPDGITMVPDYIQVQYDDVMDMDSEEELPTAQVTTEGDHVSIIKYEIAKSETSKFFSISSTGEFSVVRGSEELLPGVYSVSLKLTTGASGEDEGIFEDAITVNVTSKPLGLTYTPATGKLEEESALSGKTTYSSVAPELKGSLESLAYSIKSVTPETDKIKIDPKTGVIFVEADHGLVTGQKFIIDVKVMNEFAPEGVDFDNVFELEIVEFIEPVDNFAYNDFSEIQAVEFEVKLADGFKGDEVSFELIDLPAALVGQLSVNHEGTITAKKGHSIPVGTHEVKVKATNPKSDPEIPTVATLTLTITANPNYFTYVHYGNNLSLTPSKNYANQYRVNSGATYPSDNDPKIVPETDATVELTYELTKLHQVNGLTINATTGELNITANTNAQLGIAIITATAGKGTKAEVSVSTPVFFDYATTVKDNMSSDMVKVTYDPFVLQVNPRAGARSVTPEITGRTQSNFFMDYRRNFNYYNYKGNHISGQLANDNKDNFLGAMWNSYYTSIGNPSPNYGAKEPISTYATNTTYPSTKSDKLTYVDPVDYSIVVNPNKWLENGEYANGFFHAQITFSSSNSGTNDLNNGGQVFPIVLWFDTNF